MATELSEAARKANIDRLLGILHVHAPTSTAQMQCNELLQQMQRDGISGHQQELILTQALLDGLQFGNWIWLR